MKMSESPQSPIHPHWAAHTRLGPLPRCAGQTLSYYYSSPTRFRWHFGRYEDHPSRCISIAVPTRFGGVGCYLYPDPEGQGGGFLVGDCGQECSHQENWKGRVSALRYPPSPSLCLLSVHLYSSEEQPAFFHSYKYLRGNKLGVIRLNPEVVRRVSRDGLDHGFGFNIGSRRGCHVSLSYAAGGTCIVKV